MEKITEQSSLYDDLEKKSVGELLECMNHEDRLVPEAVGQCLPQIEKLVSELVDRMKRGGRLFYIGAGTSGRLGILDASEVPPTFGVPHGWVVGLIAGGDRAIRRAVESAEDQLDGAWNDLQEFAIGQDDVLVGIAASGTTPYVVGGLRMARQQ
ncbi:MAG: N-acetylmuramic acid 6-phosphate etherase, partial [Planctomycetaceae bacterium]|nr:N-acetylmuramic acid 6-phosphate etherase [Planctomycetaceae bacterium]